MPQMYVVNAKGRLTGEEHVLNVEANSADDVYDMIVDLGLVVASDGYGAIPDFRDDSEVLP